MSEIVIVRDKCSDKFYIKISGTGTTLEVSLLLTQRFDTAVQPEKWYVRQRHGLFTDYYKKSTKLELLLRVGVSLEKILRLCRNMQKNECISLSPRKLPR